LPESLSDLVVAAGILAAYHAGKWVERKRVCRWLRFLHGEVGELDTSPHRLAAAISVGQHYDYEEE
jgi:hypothetical protein